MKGCCFFYSLSYHSSLSGSLTFCWCSISINWMIKYHLDEPLCSLHMIPIFLQSTSSLLSIATVFEDSKEHDTSDGNSFDTEKNILTNVSRKLSQIKVHIITNYMSLQFWSPKSSDSYLKRSNIGLHFWSHIIFICNLGFTWTISQL